MWSKAEKTAVQMNANLAEAAQHIEAMNTEIMTNKEEERFKKGIDEFADRTRAVVGQQQKASEERIWAVRKEVSDWAETFQKTILDKLQRGGGGQDPGAPSSSGRVPGIDKKDVVVWKLAETTTKSDFRHWCDAIDTNLDAAQIMPLPEIILD